MDRLQEAEVELIDRTRCNQLNWYDGFITENMLCAGLESGAADTCQVWLWTGVFWKSLQGLTSVTQWGCLCPVQGDSGGPLQCYSENDESFYVVGVTSFGEKCGLPHRPGVYARTSKFADWLKASQVAAAASAAQCNTRLITALLSAALMLLWITQSVCNKYKNGSECYCHGWINKSSWICTIFLDSF